MPKKYNLLRLILEIEKFENTWIGVNMEKRDVVSFSRDIENKLNLRYKDQTLCNQYAWWMIEAVTNKKKSELISQKEFGFTKKQIDTLDNWTKKQIDEKIPLQYLLGSVPFDDLDILVEPPILIPRPETEEMCYKIINMLKQLDNKKINILDIGTGSGCIALALAKAFPASTVWATDISDEALKLANKNATHNKITNVQFLKSDVFKQINPENRFDLIVSNPPYIAEHEWRTLDQSVTKWEDKKALVANQEGLSIIEQIVIQAPVFIKKNKEMSEKKLPQLIIEIGHKQGPTVIKLFETAGFVDIVVERDLEGKDRFIKGRVKNVAMGKKEGTKK